METEDAPGQFRVHGELFPMTSACGMGGILLNTHKTLSPGLRPTLPHYMPMFSFEHECSMHTVEMTYNGVEFFN